MVSAEVIILSDLWGVRNSPWLSIYQEELREHHSVRTIDCRELAGIDPHLESKQQIHQEFVQRGIDIATQKLADAGVEGSAVLGFSIGGLIAWKAALHGAAFKKIIAVSSTRLRYETDKPSIAVELFFGDQDPHRPNKQWFEQVNVIPELLVGDHAMYRKPEYVKTLIKGI